MASRLARYDAHRQAAKHARDTADQISHRRLEEMKQSESFYDIYNKYTKPSRYLPSQALTLQDSDIHYDTRPVPIDSEELTQTTKRQKTRGKRGGRATELPRLRIGNQDVDTLEYLGSAEWVDYLCTLNDSFIDGEMSPILKSVPKPWQVVGTERMIRLARSVFGGGILADPVGLGKSLTALLAALRLRTPGSGFILVVCKKGSLIQWLREVTMHFKPEHRPKTMILTRLDVPVTQLLSYDIVICSHSFLRQCYSAKLEYEISQDLAIHKHQPGRPAGVPTSLPSMPLHSRLYEHLGKDVSVLIVDESHEAKNANSVLAAAIRSIRCEVVFLLSGTPFYNRWTDIFGQLSLLPRCPFRSINHFRELFASSTPDKLALKLLIRLLSGLLVARPKSILSLPPIIMEDIKVDMSTKRARSHLCVIEKAVKNGKYSLYLAKSEPKEAREHVAQAMANFAKARSYAASPLLATAYVETVQAATGREPSRNSGDETDPGEEWGYASLYQGGGGCSEDDPSLSSDAGSDGGGSGDGGGRENAVSGNGGFDNGGNGASEDNGSRLESEKDMSGDESDPASNADSEDDEINTNNDKFNPNSNEVNPNDDEFNPDDDEFNPDDDEFNLDDDELNLDGDAVNFDGDADLEADGEVPILINNPRVVEELAQKWTRKGIADMNDIEFNLFKLQYVNEKNSSNRSEYRIVVVRKSYSEWREIVSGASDEEIFSPRAEAIVQKVQDIRTGSSTDKIIIVSTMLRFLDVISAGLHRRMDQGSIPASGIAEYNGKITSSDCRHRILQEFNDAQGTSQILLLTATAGGTGLNIAGASHVIICEPVWSPGLEEQIIGRAHRIRQTKTVYVYRVSSEQSVIDNYVEGIAQNKTGLLDEILCVLQREDRDGFIVPPLSRKYESWAKDNDGSILGAPAM